MEKISGAANWNITYAELDGEILVLRAVTCDEDAVLPDTLSDLPVTGLWEMALADDAPAIDRDARDFRDMIAKKMGRGPKSTVIKRAGQPENHDNEFPEPDELRIDDLEIRCGAPDREFWNRNIRSLILPRTLKSVGNYAFYNLRSLERLIVSDGITDWGTGALMNTIVLKSAVISHVQGGSTGSAYFIADSISRELDFTVELSDGSRARLILPEYFEEYEENTPAHIFNLKVSGGGYRYHALFKDPAVNLSGYDALWDNFLKAEHEDDTALRMAWHRLMQPVGLSAPAREKYLAYLEEHLTQALRLALMEMNSRDDFPDFCLRNACSGLDSENGTSGIKLLLEMPSLTEEILSEVTEEARRNDQTEALTLLLECRHRRFGRRRTKNYEL